MATSIIDYEKVDPLVFIGVTAVTTLRIISAATFVGRFPGNREFCSSNR
jgi:hypothetical protein